jgi:hypothetical protein
VLSLLTALSMQIALQACSVAGQQKPEHRIYVKAGGALLDFVPDGWYWSNNRSFEATRMPTNYYFPAGQDWETWEELLTVIQPKQRKGSGAPAETIDEDIRIDYAPGCESLKVEAIDETTRNNYPMATKLMYCSRDRRSPRGKGGIGIFKAINTMSGPVIVLRQLRLDPFDVNAPPLSAEKRAELLNWANRISMCNAHDPARPCPPVKWW